MNKSLSAIFSLGWQSIAYGVGVVGSQFVTYLLIPILTHYMPQEEYGAVSVITTIYVFLNVLTYAGLRPTAFRFYHEHKDEEYRRLIVGTSQFLFFLFAAIPAIGFVVFSNPLSLILLGSDQYALALQYMAGFMVFDTMTSFGNVILRIQVRPLASSVHTIIAIALKTGLAILFVVGFDMGVTGYWLGYLAGGIIGFLIMIWLVRSVLVFKISKDLIINLVKFGLPLIPANLAMITLRLADRYIIGTLAGLDQVAIYDVGYKVGSSISLIISPFRIAWNPFAFAIAKKPEAQKVYRDVLTYLIAGCVFLILSVSAFRSEIVRIFAPASYANSTNIVIWVAASQLFLATYLVFSTGLMVANRTGQLGWVGVIAGGINLTLNFILIPLMGILGAAISTLVSYLTLSVSVYYLSKRSFPVSIAWKQMYKLLFASGIAGMLILLSDLFPNSPWAGITLKISALVSYLAFLFFSRFIKKSQIIALIEMGKSQTIKKFSAHIE